MHGYSNSAERNLQYRQGWRSLLLRNAVIVNKDRPRCPVDADMPILAFLDVIVEEVEDCF